MTTFPTYTNFNITPRHLANKHYFCARFKKKKKWNQLKL